MRRTTRQKERTNYVAWNLDLLVRCSHVARACGPGDRSSGGPLVMAKIFTELSPNQRAAIGTPCRKCGVGEYRERSGKFGPWVQCSRDECGDKVHRPRGCHAPKDEPQAPAEIDQEM